MTTDDGSRAKNKRPKKKDEQGHLETVREYYLTVILTRGRKLSKDQQDEADRRLQEFEAWLYNGAMVRLKIRALEYYYFELAPAHKPILKDLLARAEKCRAMLEDEIEQTQAETLPRMKTRRRREKVTQ